MCLPSHVKGEILKMMAVVVLSASLADDYPLHAEQSKASAARGTQPPRTVAGHPDLSGLWSFYTLSPVNRPPEFAGKEFMSEKEAAALEAVARAHPRNQSFTGFVDWDLSHIVATRRTSLVIDPPDGRIPALTPEGERQELARLDRMFQTAGPEDRDLSERCLVGTNAGPPMLPGAYNNNMRLFQTRDHVAIVTEMIHNARIIPLDGRPHLPSDVRQWAGDSRGRWEGDTLVVETTNFSEKYHGAPVGAHRGYGGTLHLIERFKLMDAQTLLYEFTINSPAVYTRPWTAQFTMTKFDGQMYEYACHEGNYGMMDALSGYRADERNGVTSKAVSGPPRSEVVSDPATRELAKLGTPAGSDVPGTANCPDPFSPACPAWEKRHRR